MGTTILDRTTVYVRLLNEGTDVWRPVAATRIGSGYLLNGPQPDDEEWEFKPGESVICDLRRFEGKPDEFLVATRHSHPT
jgi:hypothetical protein